MLHDVPSIFCAAICPITTRYWANPTILHWSY